MSNNKQQTAVGWFSNQAHELFEQYSEGKFDRVTLNKLMLEATEKAKEMEKEQIEDAHNQGIWPTPKAFDDGEQYYNETYGDPEQAIIDYNKMEEESEMDNYNEMKDEQDKIN